VLFNIAFQYKACREVSILPFIGLEAYVVLDRNDKKAKRNHLSLISYTTDGYKNLAKLSTLSHERDHYHYKPLLDMNDLAEISANGMLKGIACLTGCYFGLVSQAIVRGESQKAEKIVKTLDQVFEKVFVEVQNHKSDHGDGWNDDKLVHELFTMANWLGLPTIASQDSHYCDKERKRPAQHDANDCLFGRRERFGLPRPQLPFVKYAMDKTTVYP
jgi:DNA polymerase III subunit alpha